MKKINYNRLKTFLFVIGICFSAHSVLGQSTNTEFFMSSSFTNNAINPAKRPETGYIGIPGLTNFYADFKTNTLNLNTFVFPGSPQAKTFLHPDISYNQFMKGIANNNYGNANVDWTILGVGFYKNDLFLNFDLSVRSDVGVNVPKDVFSFVKQGIRLGEEKTYDLSGISGQGNLFAQIGAGASYPLLDNALMVGAKAKILLGMANFRFNVDRLQLNVERNLWTMDSQASMQIVYPGMTPTYDEEGLFDGFENEGKFPGFNGFGLGLDLGATFKPASYFDFAENLEFMDNVTVSWALTDIGFISWGKKNALYMATGPSKTTITGNHEITFEDNSNIVDNLTDSLKRAINLIEGPNGNIKRTSGLKAAMNFGVEYEIIQDELNVGLLSTTYFNTIKTMTELTLGGAYRPAKWVELGLSYSFVRSNFQTFGFSVHLGPGFFIASDYIIPHVNSDFIPTTSKGMNLQVGAVIPLGKKQK
jgi:hypothetical protein